MNTFSSMHAAPAADMDDSFYGTLDLGHATQINDDLVRAIRDEVADIDSRLRAVSDGVRNEERSLGQLTRDCDHARGEMSAHRRDAAEVLDSENMTQELRAGFRAQFASEVAPHVVSPASSGPAHHYRRHDIQRDVTSEDDESVATSGGTTVTKAFSHKAFVDRRRVDARGRAVANHAIQQEIKDTRNKIKAADDEAARYNQEVIVRQLDRVKTEAERQVEARRRECEAEGQRNRGVREAAQVARANSGAYAQQIAEKATEQMAERSSHVSRESALASLNEARQHELVLLEADEKKFDAELANLSGQLDFLVKQAAEFESEQKKSVDMKEEADEIHRDIDDLASIKESKVKEAEASNADLQSASAALEEAINEVAASNADKLANDKAVVEVLNPANARRADAIKEKEQLSGNIVALQKSVEKIRSSNEDAATSSRARVIAKSNELKAQNAELDAARANFDEMQKRDATAAATLLSEKREYEEFATKFEAATNAEIARMEVLTRERSDVREGLLEKRRSELSLLEQAQREDVDNLKQACTLIQEMKDIRTTIEETALLDENGRMNEEVFDGLPDYERRILGIQLVPAHKDGDIYDDHDEKDDTTSVDNEAGSPEPRRSRRKVG